MWWLSSTVRKGQQPPWIVPDALWERIRPLLPVVPRRADHPGRKRLDDRKVLSGHLVCPVHGNPVGVPAPGAGVRLGHDCLAAAAGLAGSWGMAAAARGAAGRAERRRSFGLVAGGDRQLPRAGAEGRPKTGPSPADRARPGSKHHLITEAHGIPLAVSLTGGNRNDITQLIPQIEAIPPVRGRRGRPRRRPANLYADRGYDQLLRPQWPS
jgi:hypothetical protein